MENVKERILKIFTAITILLVIAVVLFSGCASEFPSSALYVGEKEKYKTIQSALDSQEFDGQYIVVKSGKYKEDLSVSRPVTIIGKTASCSLLGSVEISSGGVKIQKIAFIGEKSQQENAIEISGSGILKSIQLVNCTFMGYKGSGIVSESASVTIENLVVKESRFRENGKNGVLIRNVSGATFDECFFEENGAESDEVNIGYGLNINLIEGDFGGIGLVDCEFYKNGKKDGGLGGAINAISSTKYKGEIVVENCLFQNNINDISSGKQGNNDSKIEIEIVRQRGFLPDIADMTAL